jgi:hypothetical protein
MLAAGDALACATCQCGDYTLTLMGFEKAFSGRTRVAFDWMDREEEQGSGAGRRTLRDDSWFASASYAFTPDLSVGLRVPFTRKTADDATLARDEATGLGDADLVVKYALGQVGEATARHIWGVQGALRTPTSSERKDDAGTPVDIDAQPGTGAWAPGLGAWYGYFRYPAMVYASVLASNPGPGYQGLNGGAALVATLTTQRALTQDFSLQLGLEARYARRNRFFGVDDPDSGGTAGFLAPGVVWSPAMDWILHLSAQIPVWRNLNGEQHERGDIRLGVAFDLPRE